MSQLKQLAMQMMVLVLFKKIIKSEIMLHLSRIPVALLQD